MLINMLNCMACMQSAPCHNLRTVDVSRSNVGACGHSYLANVFESDKRLLSLSVGPFSQADISEAEVKQRLLAAPEVRITVPWPLVNKTTFMLCMKYSCAMQGRYVPSDVFNVIFSFLRSDLVRKVSCDVV